MVVKVKGLVIKSRSIGEKDVIITILSGEYGIIEASVRGAKSIKSKLLAGTGMLCYSDFALFKGKSNYIVNSADVIEPFYDLRLDIEKMSLASYFCDVLRYIVTEQASHDDLRLMLNTLYMLNTDKKSVLFLKSVFEFKLICNSGFMPSLSECANCGAGEIQKGVIHISDGAVYCEKCIRNDGLSIKITKSILLALRHISDEEMTKIYSFNLDDKGIEYLNKITENYLLYHCDTTFKSLNFLKNLPTL